MDTIKAINQAREELIGRLDHDEEGVEVVEMHYTKGRPFMAIFAHFGMVRMWTENGKQVWENSEGEDITSEFIEYMEQLK